MRRITTEELREEISAEKSRNFQAEADEIVDSFIGKDDIGQGSLMDATSVRLSKILSLLEGNLEGRIILDLGCGSVHTSDNRISYKKSRSFEPWLCRILATTESYPVGIDKYENSEEDFESYTIDLMTPNSLSFFEDNRFDLAYAWELFDSPCFIDTYGRKAGTRLWNNLIPQLNRIVKQEGYFLYSD